MAQRCGKKVEVEIRGGELELDRSILDRLSDPLVHLLRNAVDHGIEAPEVRTASGKPEHGRIAIDARLEKDTIRIAVSDDGAGMDLEGVRRRAVECTQRAVEALTQVNPSPARSVLEHVASELAGRAA